MRSIALKHSWRPMAAILLAGCGPARRGADEAVSGGGSAASICRLPAGSAGLRQARGGGTSDRAAGRCRRTGRRHPVGPNIGDCGASGSRQVPQGTRYSPYAGRQYPPTEPVTCRSRLARAHRRVGADAGGSGAHVERRKKPRREALRAGEQRLGVDTAASHRHYAVHARLRRRVVDHPTTLRDGFLRASPIFENQKRGRRCRDDAGAPHAGTLQTPRTQIPLPIRSNMFTPQPPS